jgi:hypothetical protein
MSTRAEFHFLECLLLQLLRLLSNKEVRLNPVESGQVLVRVKVLRHEVNLGAIIEPNNLIRLIVRSNKTTRTKFEKGFDCRSL